MLTKKAIMHVGTPRHSGRYPWGSGEDPYQSASGLLGYIKELEDQGLSQLQIAQGLGLSTTQLRAKKRMAVIEKRAGDRAMALRLKDKGLSNVAIGERMGGLNESTVRSLLDPAISERKSISANTAQALKEGLNSGGYLQIGSGVEARLGVNKTTFDTAVALLQEEGYQVHTIKVRQLGTDKFTNLKVLALPGTPFEEVSRNREQIHVIDRYSEDRGRTFLGLEPIKSVDGSRVLIRYAEDGGAEKDGVIELRRGPLDTSLGGAPYAQVRIGVDGTHFMKGMAVYGDDFPEGIDFIYNTRHTKETPRNEVFKSMKEDPDNPFASTVRQRHYMDAEGNLQLSPINLVGSKEGSGEEGYWGTWSRNLSSQILSKQSPALAKKQLDLAYNMRAEDFEEIMSVTNPAVKKRLLLSLADDADSAASDLKAAAMPRQGNHVILPIGSLGDDEIFAPNYKNGEVVTVFRHPHGGIFEAPTLRVNNNNPEALRIIGGKARDAVGINSNVAARLSGADFDGDSVIVIPNNHRELKTSPSIASLRNFDPLTSYKGDGTPTMDERTKGIEMGKISNLITDMTIKGATNDEIARAVRHSMVVIDAYKHKLNYKQSYLDHGIAQLKERYQGSSTAGATTVISRASAEIRVPERKEGRLIVDPTTGKKRRLFIDPETGDKLYEETGRTVINKKGKEIPRMTKITRMSKEKDAERLSSGTLIEQVYVNYANNLKTLARRARLAVLDTEDTPYSQSAYKVYANEVRALKNKLLLVSSNRPLERQAQLVANAIVRAKRLENPGMSKKDLKRLKGQALEEARARMGAKKPAIQITDREWQAIQAGAISPTALDSILKNCNMSEIRIRALPAHSSRGLSPARVIRAKAMLDLGNTRSDVAEALGISVAVLDRCLREEEE